MEKFAVDLDKVLDEFEFNEDCAEQVASVGESESHVPSVIIPQNQNFPTTTITTTTTTTTTAAAATIATKTLNQRPVDDTDTEIYKDHVKNISDKKSINIQQLNKVDNINIYQPKEKVDETLDIRKSDIIHGNGESVNDFSKVDYQIDDKVQQKRACDFREVEPVSLTIHNDITQKLVQKRHNDNTNKNHNSYDKKLNQPNIKPSVSNVFNSLNEYINASSASMERIDCSIDNKNDCSNSSKTSSHDKQINIITTVKDDNEKDLDEQKCVVNSQINKPSIKTSLPKYQNILLPMKCDSHGVVNKNNKEKNLSDSIAISNTMHKSVTLLQQNQSLETKGIVDCSKHTYENVDINIPSNKEIYKTVDKSNSRIGSRSTSQDETKHIYENVDFGQSNISTDKETVYECIYIGNKNELPETTTELEIAAKRLNEQFPTVKTSSSETEISYINPAKLVFQTVNINPPQVERKPVGFSTIDDLSEEELNIYLAELEAEERATEEAAAVAAANDAVATAVYENVSVPGPSVKTHTNKSDSVGTKRIISARHDVDDDNKDDDDEDANEAPIFENVTIGELPCVSEEELQEKAKKFPIIDYSKSGTDGESSDFLEMNDSEKIHDHVKIISESKERKVKKIVEKQLSKSSVESTIMIMDENKQSTEHENVNISYKIDSDICNQPNQSNDIKILKDNNSQDTDIIDNLHVSGDPQALNKSSTILQGKEIKNNLTITNNVCDEIHGNSESPIQLENDTITSAEITNELSTIVNDTIKDLSKVIGSNSDNTNEYINSEEDLEGRPLRPQTLNIISTVNMDDHTTIGLPGDTPGVQESLLPSETIPITATTTTDEAVIRERDPSPDASDNSSMEFGIVLGKQPPFWVPDSDAPNCMLCDVRFNVIKRRHHCRACGKVLCNKCCGMKYRLEYQGNMDSRVCSPCYQQLIRVENEPGNSDWSTGYVNNAGGSINSPQLAGGLPPPPTVMVPVGVLKREGSIKQRAEGQKSVMFSDGIRPGCDLTELDTTWDLKPPYRKTGNKRITSPGTQSMTTVKRQNLPPLDSYTNSYIPQDINMLPPTVTIHKGQISYHEVVDSNGLYTSLMNEVEPPVMFAVNRNLYAYVKITNLNCCVNRICWSVTSRGLACVGQDEVILLIEMLPDETQIPRDLLIHINQLYIEAIKGNTITELGVSIHQNGNLLGSREHAGFLFIRQTFQCLQKIILPPSPFLVGLLVHRWETPWAKVFPLRLVLRLGAEYRYYPCPLVSVRFRDAVYFEIGHTIMKVLADFRNYAYTLPSVRGLTIHMQDRTTDVLFPRNRYDQVIKGLNNSNDHVLAFAANFSIHADSHLVCIQTNTGDESSYQTQAINIHNKPRKVTGASFVVINGALKSSMGLSAKSSIVEDGLMVQIMPEKMEALKAALKNMQDFSIGCGRQGAPEPDETVNIKWVDNDVQFNLGVKSPIDGKPMDGIPSIRVHNGTDYMGTSRFIRWTEVFIIKSDDHPNGVHDPVDINKLAEAIARATCTALVKLLDLLATAGLTKLSVRTTIHPDNVGYEAGSEGTRLPPIYMNSLDNELIQVLHKAAQYSHDTNTVLELIFHVLDD
ncbi:hypothetical protein PV327_001270 [Microctonus hyperodae]|uniref:FYVE-type domain-containing protein n=1 Tax=Microctonus hyperodae TaxID=165561 RepID=A0AA39L386_MICHY|nr:hypothetical protein PV327_001270 [Microctonus hyperodae]